MRSKMKKNIICLILVLSVTLLAQEKKEVNISQKVKAKFSKIYPNAKDVQWMKNVDVINATFIKDRKRVGVVFKADTLFATMTEIEVKDLPKQVKKHLDNYYKGYSIIQTGTMRFAGEHEKGNIAYGADVTNGKVAKRVIFYPNGDEYAVSNIPIPKK